MSHDAPACMRKPLARPVLAIGGEHDHVAPLDQLAAFARAVPAAQTVVLRGVGHMVMLERADAFTDEVLAFLQQQRS